MKILVTTPIFPPEIGGPSTYVPEFQSRVKNTHHECFVVTYYSKKIKGNKSDVYGVNHNLPIVVKQLVFAYIAIKVVLEKKIDLIYAYEPVVTGLTSFLVSKLTGTRLIQRVVNDSSWEYARNNGKTTLDLNEFQDSRKNLSVRIVRLIQVFVSKNADYVITPSNYIKKLVTGWGIQDEKIGVIYNAVNKDIEKNIKPTMPTGVNILTAGRLASWKNFNEVISAVSKLEQKVNLIIVGEGEEKEKLMNQAKKLAQNVSFPGKLEPEALRAYMVSSNIFILFSSYEGLSHTLLEAMSEGCLVIASDIESNCEVIQDKVAGFLVSLHNVQELTDKITGVINMPEAEKQRIRSKAKEKAASFSWERNIQETLQIFAKVVSKDG